MFNWQGYLFPLFLILHHTALFSKGKSQKMIVSLERKNKLHLVPLGISVQRVKMRKAAERCRICVHLVEFHRLNPPAGWFPQSRLPRGSWWLAPSSATAGGPRLRPDRPVLWLTGLLHSLNALLARGTCCPEVLMEVRNPFHLIVHINVQLNPWLCCYLITCPSWQVHKTDWWMGVTYWLKRGIYGFPYFQHECEEKNAGCPYSTGTFSIH